ncbi:MAG: hypothetical protein ACJAT1_000535, partial [Marivirga sp.]
KLSLSQKLSMLNIFYCTFEIKVAKVIVLTNNKNN